MKLFGEILNAVFWNVIGVTPITLLCLSREIPGFASLPLVMICGSDD